MRTFVMVSMMVLSACNGGRDRGDDPDPAECRCEGAVPEGHLSARCGEAACVSGVGGYLCTGENTAVASPDACLFADASVPGTDAGPGHDAGPAHDAGTTTHDAGTTTRDAGTPDPDCTAATCAAFAGSFTGTYEIYTAERVGSTIVNEMRCTGTSSLTVDFSATSALSGTVTCTYPGSLSAFDRNQSGTVQARVRPDGSITGSVTHQFDAFDSGSRRTFAFDGTIAPARVDVMDTGSWRPHPMSAVPWDVDITIAATR